MGTWWRSSCNTYYLNTIGTATAAVACFELYQNDTVISYSQGNTCDYADFWLDDILCESDDYTLGDCQHFPYGNHNC